MDWSDEKESAYRMWLRQWSKNTGISYNPDDLTYDYREAYKRGLSPSWQPEHQQYRWSDIGKTKDYRESQWNLDNIMEMPLEEAPLPYHNWRKEFDPYIVKSLRDAVLAKRHQELFDRKKMISLKDSVKRT